MQTYAKRITLTNNLTASVEVSIRAGSTERYTVRPSTLRLGPGQAGAVEVQLRVLKFAQRQKATTQGHRDIFHIKVRDCLHSGEVFAVLVTAGY